MEVPLRQSYAGEVQSGHPEAALAMGPGPLEKKKRKKGGGLSAAAGRGRALCCQASTPATGVESG
jgi:hypothetical protein